MSMLEPDEAQEDLFLGAAGDVALRDSLSLLEFPFFGLSRRASHDPMVFSKGDVNIRVTAGEKGIATIWDRDLIIYALSIVNAAVENGIEPHRRIRFVAHDFLKKTKRGTGKRAYEQLADALERLRSTTIITDIESAGERERRGFGWIDTFRQNELVTKSGDRRMSNIEIEINAWLFRGLVKDRKSVLGITPEYFALQSGLERRLYQIARKHCGSQPSWKISLGKLAAKVGTTQALRFFKRDLQEAIEADNIPEYLFRLDTGVEFSEEMRSQRQAPKKPAAEGLMVVVTRREGLHVPGRVLRAAEAGMVSMDLDDGAALVFSDGDHEAEYDARD